MRFKSCVEVKASSCAMICATVSINIYLLGTNVFAADRHPCASQTPPEMLADVSSFLLRIQS